MPLSVIPEEVINFLDDKFGFVIDEKKTSSSTTVYRSRISDAAMAKEFIVTFSLRTNTRWVVYYSIAHPERLAYRKTWICRYSHVHKTKNSKHNVHCRATITIKVKKITQNTRRRDAYLKCSPPLCAIIHLNLDHSHFVSHPGGDDFRQLSCKDQSLPKIVSVESGEPEIDSSGSEAEDFLEAPECEDSSDSTSSTAHLNITKINSSSCDAVLGDKTSNCGISLNNATCGLKKISAKESNLSEFTVFGLYVASQLQQLPIQKAYILKEKIQSLLNDSCPQSLKEPSFFSYTPQTLSNATEDSASNDLQTIPPIKAKEDTFQLPVHTYVNSYKMFTLQEPDFSNIVYFENKV